MKDSPVERRRGDMGQESRKGDSGIKSGHTTATMSEGHVGCTSRESFVLDKVRVNSSARYPVRVAMVLGAFVAGHQISWTNVYRPSHHPDTSP